MAYSARIGAGTPAISLHHHEPGPRTQGGGRTGTNDHVLEVTQTHIHIHTHTFTPCVIVYTTKKYTRLQKSYKNLT